MRALLILLALTTPALAGSNELSLGGASRALRSASANAVTPDSLDGVQVTYARRFEVDLSPRLEVWATAAMLDGSASGELFRTMRTDVSSFQLTAGGRARYRLHRNVAVGAHLDLGYASTSLALDDRAGHAVKDGHWAPISTAAVTLDLVGMALPQVSVGIRFELGYTAMAAVEMTGTSTGGDASTIKLQMMQASLGHLDLGGPSFGTALITQF